MKTQGIVSGWVFCLLLGLCGFSGVTAAMGQSGTVRGAVFVDSLPAPFAAVYLAGTRYGVSTDADGRFELGSVPTGSVEITASYVGFEAVTRTIELLPGQITELSFYLAEPLFVLNDVVVTGTKTARRQTDAPVLVNILNSETLASVQACNLSEGLRFQPGLRVETDCQTCNYTQLRMNGLGGGYSQILINGRPIFSPLTGLYGLEQLPVQMIERIEVVRGGGSSLYGSSAIGGTVNVITKIPTRNTWQLDYSWQNINGGANDHLAGGNATYVTPNDKLGASVFFNHRSRPTYDHNGDDFSELPQLRNNAWGANLFFLPTEDQKLELNVSNLYEYRYGGEMMEGPAHFAGQSEERYHRVWMGSADYQINWRDDRISLISYFAWQHTGRDHYTGIFPDDEEEISEHLAFPPYGTSIATTIQGGLQFNNRFTEFLGGTNVLTAGIEVVSDKVLDEIDAYDYLVDQQTVDLGVFLQSDWEIRPTLSLLSGLRMDKHNLVDRLVFSPRASLLYKVRNTTQFRINYGAGFRAPQAFDTDLHIAFAGGGVSLVSLAPDLGPERSHSISGSVNFDKASDRFIAGFTIEGFYTRLNDAFYLESLGTDQYGEVFEKRNGQGATVQGATLELRANYNGVLQVQGGFTVQSSRFDEAVTHVDGIAATREFMRTPKDYGFATLTASPVERLKLDVNYVYTGRMKVPHLAGAPEQDVDVIVNSPRFHELSLKAGYEIPVKAWKSRIELYVGVKNVTGAYQSDFDTGKNRDSNYVYGPSMPRTFFAGLKLGTLR